MRDLDLWRRLSTGDVTPEDLRAFAEWTLPRRAPYLGRILPLVTHADPSIRCAALASIAGARGMPALRAITARLDDDEEAVRREAIDALRVTARDAGGRYVHALFHHRLDVRRAALHDVPQGALEMAAYLRADPACADRISDDTVWPKQRLPLVFDLHAAGHLPSAAFLKIVTYSTIHELLAFFATEHGRTTEEIDAYLEAMPAKLTVAPGHDVIDQIVRAIDEAGAYGRDLEHLVNTITTKPQKLLRRAIVALASHLAGHTSPHLWGALCAFEPRVVEGASFDRTQARAVAASLIRYAWPVRPPGPVVVRILDVDWVKTDLALAAGIAGLHSVHRVARLIKALGLDAVVDALLASDHGWEEICRLPQESSKRELKLLEAIAKREPERHASLAGIALGVFSGKRLEGFIDQLPRHVRHPAFLALTRTGIAADDPQLLTACVMLASRIDRVGFAEILGTLLGPGTGERELAIVLIVARAMTDKMLASAVRLVEDAAARRLIAAIDGVDALPRDREIALAQAMAERTDHVLRGWGQRMQRLVVAEVPSVPLPAVRARRALDPTQRAEIATAPAAGLEKALEIAMIAPTTGLVEALRSRKAVPSVAACAALLGCADPLEEVAVQLDRFADHTARFDSELDNAAAALWGTGTDLPPLAHARLWRWEAHGVELRRWIDRAGGFHTAVLGIDGLGGQLAQLTMWRGIAESLVYLRYRDRPRFLAEGTLALAQFAALRVDRAYGREAARVCVALVEGGAVPLSNIRKVILDRTPDSDVPTREQLARLIRLDGMPTPPRSAEVTPPAADVLAQIRASRDLDALDAWCTDPRSAIVQEAVLVLLLLGEDGQLRLAKLLTQITDLLAPVPLLASIALWDAPSALAVAHALAADTTLPPEWQFHLCIGLRDGERALAAVRAPSDVSWFRRGDWDVLTRHVAPLACALALADSAHHHAYARALELLLAEVADDPEVASALRRFLEISSARPIELRRNVALRLVIDAKDLTGLPILIGELVDEGTRGWLDRIPRAAGATITIAIADAAMIGGHGACTEKRMWELLGTLSSLKLLETELRSEIYTRVLDDAMTTASRSHAAQLAVGDALAHARLVDVAEVFAWGIRRGVELTGRMFRFHMTTKERDLGHTFLDGSRIFVSALPMLRGEAHGRDVVEGLVLHEIGHHVYHRGELEQRLWKQAHQEGIGHLLNLIADEHLERNLRGVDSAYGDRLKRLGSYGFQHAPQELKILRLLQSLRGSAAVALTGTELDVAYDEASVRLRRGAILAELEKHGHPLARFARALRMGLGNRTGDPRVAAALALCGKDLRKLDMQGLYDLTKRLAALFGGSIAVASVFGGPEGLEFGERDEEVFGAGIDDGILQREVERILDPKSTKGRRAASGPRDRLQINVSPDEEFDRITNVEKVRGSAQEHRILAAEVNRHSVRLRAHLDDLGLRWESAHARIKGHALDRSRLLALVTRGDPKILKARQPVRRTDLFLGTIIDCSGSMQAGKNIERARKFGVMIAEAVRPLPGVEARFFGFTDSTIYDAGDSDDCNVTALHADGGNNDAAALFHAANVALASRKRARVLVMISDGLPTECSVAALRSLVTTLTKRKGIVCAQVAVRKIEEQAFANYVVLDDAEPDIAVARFGRMIGDLTRRALAT